MVVPPSTRPAPTSAAIATASPSLAPASPTPDPSSTAAPALGGGLILVRDVARDADGIPIDTVHGFGTGTYAVYSLDAASGERTLLGTLPYDWNTAYTPDLQWASDRTYVLFSNQARQHVGTRHADRSGSTSGPGMLRATRGRRLGLLGRRAADRRGCIGSSKRVPGQQGTTGVVDAVVVTNVDGTDARTLPLPTGADSGAAGEVGLLVAGRIGCGRRGLPAMQLRRPREEANQRDPLASLHRPHRRVACARAP